MSGRGGEEMKRKHKRGNKNARRPVMKVIIKREMVKEAEVIIDKINRAYGASHTLCFEVVFDYHA